LKHIDTFGIIPMQGLAASVKEAEVEGRLSRSISLPDTTWQLTVQPLHLKGSAPAYLITAIPEKELFAAALKIRAASISSIVIILLLAVPAIWLVARTISRSIRLLTNEAEMVRHFDFDSPIKVTSIISEVHALAGTMALMKRSIRK